MLAGQGVSVIAQAAYFIVIARVLGSAEYGVFVGAAAMVAVLGMFSSLGSGMLIVRYVSPDHEMFPEYWGNGILSVMLAGSLCVALVGLLGPRLLHTQAGGMLIMIAAGDCVFAKLTDCAGRAFQAFEQLRITATFTALTGVLRMIAAFLMWITLHHATAHQWADAYLGVSLSSRSLHLYRALRAWACRDSARACSLRGSGRESDFPLQVPRHPSMTTRTRQCSHTMGSMPQAALTRLPTRSLMSPLFRSGRFMLQRFHDSSSLEWKVRRAL